MDPIQRTLVALAVMIAAVLGGCSSENGTREQDRSGDNKASRGEHDRDSQGEGGEESGTELTLNERYDEVRNGARLILAYDAQTNSFSGTVQNTTDKSLERVRVEVGAHLTPGAHSNGCGQQIETLRTSGARKEGPQQS